MATLTALELQRLGTVRPELLAALRALLDSAESGLGLVCAVPADGGTRTLERQTQLYDDSLSQGGGTLAYPVATPGRSRHEYGAAFDLHIIAGGENDDASGSTADYRRLAELAKAVGLTAGYSFPRSDPYHFQLNETLEQSQAAWAALQQQRGVVLLAVAAVGAIVALRAMRVL